jgi:hypothetical protein
MTNNVPDEEDEDDADEFDDALEGVLKAGEEDFEEENLDEDEDFEPSDEDLINLTKELKEDIVDSLLSDE